MRKISFCRGRCVSLRRTPTASASSDSGCMPMAVSSNTSAYRLRFAGGTACFGLGMGRGACPRLKRITCSERIIQCPAFFRVWAHKDNRHCQTPGCCFLKTFSFSFRVFLCILRISLASRSRRSRNLRLESSLCFRSRFNPPLDRPISQRVQGGGEPRVSSAWFVACACSKITGSSTGDDWGGVLVEAVWIPAIENDHRPSHAPASTSGSLDVALEVTTAA